MTGTCVFCGDRVPATADDRIRFCGACLARRGPPAPEEPRSGLSPSIVALREHVLSDAPPEVQQRPRYLTNSSNPKSGDR